jgi:hypothetical protein
MTTANLHFTYHEILPDESKYLYQVNDKAFEAHLQLISSQPTAHQISFDDGHNSNYRNAFPLLERFGVKATFFVLAGKIGGDEGYLTWEEVREMSAAGHRIGSHGWSHRMLTTCNESELKQELINSKREIEDRLAIRVDAISAPGGRWNKRVLDASKEAGYDHFFHSNPWMPSQTHANCVASGRLMVTCHMGSAELRKYVGLKTGGRSVLRAKYGAKDFTRQVLGERLYHQLWCKLANWNPESGMEVQLGAPADKKTRLKHL